MSNMLEQVKSRIAEHRLAADDLKKMSLQSDTAKMFRDAFVEEEMAMADKLQSKLEKIEESESPQGVISGDRNCDRFNSGDLKADFNAAIKFYMEETGKVVYNASPGYNSSGDFIIWLLSRQR
jgi:hypothetical protein